MKQNLFKRKKNEQGLIKLLYPKICEFFSSRKLLSASVSSFNGISQYMKKFRKVPQARVLDSVGSGKINYVCQFKFRKKTLKL